MTYDRGNIYTLKLISLSHLAESCTFISTLRRHLNNTDTWHHAFEIPYFNKYLLLKDELLQMLDYLSVNWDFEILQMETTDINDMFNYTTIEVLLKTRGYTLSTIRNY
jgi:hypothetical protein